MILTLPALSACATGRGDKVAAAEAPPPGMPANPEDRLICRRETVVGTHRKRRICLYESERKRQREQDRERMGRGGSAPGDDPGGQ
jgi:hypothetical protein